jgi:hypothetical protein
LAEAGVAHSTEQFLANKPKRKYSLRALIRLGIFIGFIIGTTGADHTVGFHVANIAKAFESILLGIACGVGATLTVSLGLLLTGRLAVGSKGAGDK